MESLSNFILEKYNDKKLSVRLNEDYENIMEKLITVGGKAYPNFGNVVIMAGGAGCYPKGTEFLTSKGFKKIENYEKGDDVMQFNKEKNIVEFSKPLSYINKPNDGFYKMNLDNGSLITSKNHKHIFSDNSVNKTYELLGDEDNLDGKKFKRDFKYSGEGINISDNKLLLFVNVLLYSKKLPSNGTPKYRFCFDTISKIKMMELILKINEIDYKKDIVDGKTVLDFSITKKENYFEPYWYNCNYEQLCKISNEIVSKCNKYLEVLNFKNKESADFVHFVLQSTGINSHYFVKDNYHNIVVSFAEKSGTKSKNKIEEVVGSKNMYCFETETGYFLVRQNGKIFISGNSGKGFVKDKLLGVEGKTFDVDELKKMAMKAPKINKAVKDKFGVDLEKMNLKNPENVSILHGIIGDQMNLPRKSKASMYSSIMASDPDRKPNLIFDVTLKDLNKLNRIANDVKMLGYEKKNVHIVWVINDIEMAKKQNRERDRVVPEDILVMTHRGVSMTMNELLTGSIDVSKYMDGDIWLVFNKKGADSILKVSEKPYNPNSQSLPSNPENKKPFTIEDANTVLVKKAGKRINKGKLDFRVVKQILDYIPDQKDLTFR